MTPTEMNRLGGAATAVTRLVPAPPDLAHPDLAHPDLAHPLSSNPDPTSTGSRHSGLLPANATEAALTGPPLIRDATPADEAAWRVLWQGFLDYYAEDLAPAITAHTWARLMDPACAMQLRLVVVDGVPLGFAIHQHHPSTWVMGEDCYLEDLFVSPAARGRGLGRALINDLMALAKAKGWHRLYWHTGQDNTTARKLYDSFVAADGNIRYRLHLI